MHTLLSGARSLYHIACFRASKQSCRHSCNQSCTASAGLNRQAAESCRMWHRCIGNAVQVDQSLLTAFEACGTAAFGGAGWGAALSSSLMHDLSKYRDYRCEISNPRDESACTHKIPACTTCAASAHFLPSSIGLPPLPALLGCPSCPCISPPDMLRSCGQLLCLHEPCTIAAA